MNYYYEFEQNGSIIGYTKQVYDKSLMSQLNDKHIRNTAKFLFCNEFGLNHESVKVNLRSASKAKEICKQLIFDFKYNGGE